MNQFIDPGTGLITFALNVWATTQRTSECPHTSVRKYVVSWLEHSRESNRPLPGPPLAEFSIFIPIQIAFKQGCIFYAERPLPPKQKKGRTSMSVVV